MENKKETIGITGVILDLACFGERIQLFGCCWAALASQASWLCFFMVATTAKFQTKQFSVPQSLGIKHR